AHDRASALKARKHAGEAFRAGDRVELAPVLGEPGRPVEVVVGAERDDEDVRLVNPRVRGHAAPLGIDRDDRLADEAHARLRDRGVREADGVERRPPEHDVELRVPEDERVGRVDQRDVDLAGNLLRQRRRELQAAEAGAEDHDLQHGTILRPQSARRGAPYHRASSPRERSTPMHGVLRRSTLVAAVLALALLAALQAAAGPPGGDYTVTTLVTNVPGPTPPNHDPDLVNAWGLARSATSPWWVADNGPDPSTSKSTLYTGAGAKVPLTVSVLGGPTGAVFAGVAGNFLITTPTPGPASFIFATEAGD